MLYAVLFGGDVYKSTDRGARFQSLSAVIQPSTWTSVTVTSDGMHVFICDIHGNVWKSINGGASFNSNNAPAGKWTTVAIAGDGRTLVGLTETDFYWWPQDAFTTWYRYTDTLSSPPFAAAACSGDGRKILVANAGFVVVSNDRGWTWNFDARLYLVKAARVASSRDGVQLVATADGGSVFTSVNGGSSWQRQDTLGKGAWRGGAASATSSTTGRKMVLVAQQPGYVFIGTGSVSAVS